MIHGTSDFFMPYRLEDTIGFSQNPLGIENGVGHSFRSEADWVRGRKSICKRANLKRIHMKERAGYISCKFCFFNLRLLLTLY